MEETKTSLQIWFNFNHMAVLCLSLKTGCSMARNCRSAGKSDCVLEPTLACICSMHTVLFWFSISRMVLSHLIPNLRPSGNRLGNSLYPQNSWKCVVSKPHHQQPDITASRHQTSSTESKSTTWCPLVEFYTEPGEEVIEGEAMASQTSHDQESQV